MVEVVGEGFTGDPAWEVDAGDGAPFLQGGFDRLFQWPVATDEHAEILPVTEDRGEGLDKVLDAFFLAQPANVADEERAVAQGGGDSEGIEIEEVLVSDANFVAVRFEIPSGDETRRIENQIISQSISHMR